MTRRRERPNRLRGSRRRQLTETTIAVLAASGRRSSWRSCLPSGSSGHRRDGGSTRCSLRVDDQLGSISDSLREAVERSDEIRTGTAAERERSLDLDAGARTCGAAVPRRMAGARDRYDAELEREIAKAGATQRPLALVLIAVARAAPARARSRTRRRRSRRSLGRVTRTGDIVVRRSPEEFGVLLPATTDGRRAALPRPPACGAGDIPRSEADGFDRRRRVETERDQRVLRRARALGGRSRRRGAARALSGCARHARSALAPRDALPVLRLDWQRPVL